jgi:hypothetical protein
MDPLNLKCWLSPKIFSDSIWTIGFIQLWIKSDVNIVPIRLHGLIRVTNNLRNFAGSSNLVPSEQEVRLLHLTYLSSLFRHDGIHSFSSLSYDMSQSLPKRALHILRSKAPPFKWEYPLLSLRSSSSFLLLLPLLPFTSPPPPYLSFNNLL